MPDPDNIAEQTAAREDAAIPEQGIASIIMRHRKTLIIFTHIAMFTTSLMLAFLFAFNMQLLRKWFIYQYPLLLLVTLLVKLPIFAKFGQYRGWWRYVGISDLIGIAKASIASAIVIMIIWYGYGILPTDFILNGPVEKVRQNIRQIEENIKIAVNDKETLKLGRRLENRKGLYDLLEVSRITKLSKDLKNAKTQQEANELKKRVKKLKALQNSIEGVIMLDLFTTIMLLSGLRMVIRLYHEEFFSNTKGAVKRFLIIGAGNAGEALLREMMRLKNEDYDVIGFVDDDPAKHGMSIHGVDVLGAVENLPRICKKHNIDEIAIAIPSSTRKQLRHVVQVCEGTKIRFRTVPSITDIASGKLRVSQIRNVDIDDLLGRDVVELNLDMIEKFLKAKTILVTGAGGSIGSEMSRQVCNFKPKMLLLVEQAENPLFFIERELRKKFPDIPIKAIIANITDTGRTNEIFEKYKPQVVIHAAAHKHVPLMEDNPGEAIKNNIIGTKNVADAAGKTGVDDFVMISTDKAVNPTSIMGSSKRIAEMYIQDLNNTSNTHFVTVRFGNVLGSNGSVVPIFKKQIAEGGPVTVTHPDMQRYFMTIPEASQLVLQAATLGHGGEIFVLDMGEPVKIVHLARELITLSGFKPDEDIEIVFSGTRPGEKLFEELSIEGEDMLPTKHPKIAAWKNIPKDRDTIRSKIEKLIEIAKTQDHKLIVKHIKELIPEYIGDKQNHNN